MLKVTGIKSVDFKIIAEGFGVVNWNGPTSLVGKDGKEYANHSLPKLRGYSNLTGEKKENGYAYKKGPLDIDFTENPLYVSSNCLRHHIFAENAFDTHFSNRNNQEQLLASDVGLLRGFATVSTGAMRTSPLLITDLVDQKGNGNFEQMGRSGSKEGEGSSNTFFSKTTFGETFYEGYGSINIEELSFISIDDKFGRSAISKLKTDRIEPLVKAISDHIKRISPDHNFTAPLAVYHENYVRKGTIFDQGEAGILLSDEAVDALVDHMLDKIEYLSIKQAKGYLVVEDLVVDYNDSRKMMRIKRSPESIQGEKTQPYAVYFEGI